MVCEFRDRHTFLGSGTHVPHDSLSPLPLIGPDHHRTLGRPTGRDPELSRDGLLLERELDAQSPVP